jgi:Txe/YoeB family toxin of Txe-Axe toxin-antitoxin module
MCDHNPCWHSHRLDWANVNVLISIIYLLFLLDSINCHYKNKKKKKKKNLFSRWQTLIQKIFAFSYDQTKEEEKKQVKYLICWSRIIEHLLYIEKPEDYFITVCCVKRKKIFNWLLIIMSNKLVISIVVCHCLIRQKKEKKWYASKKKKKRIESINVGDLSLEQQDILILRCVN